MTDDDKARLFIQAIEEDAMYGEHWIDFHSHPEGCTLMEALEAAVRVLRRTLTPEEANA